LSKYRHKTNIIRNKIVDNEVADREGLELLIHSNLIVTSVEELLRLVMELKVSNLTMAWKTQDEFISEQIKRYRDKRRRDRAVLKRVYKEVKQTLNEIDQHRNESRSKRSRFES
jgi:gas vesicle protein